MAEALTKRGEVTRKVVVGVGAWPNAANEMRAEILRHCDGHTDVNVEESAETICAFCDGEPKTDEWGRPECCDKAQEAWDRNRAEELAAAKAVLGEEGLEKCSEVPGGAPGPYVCAPGRFDGAQWHLVMSGSMWKSRSIPTVAAFSYGSDAESFCNRANAQWEKAVLAAAERARQARLVALERAVVGAALLDRDVAVKVWARSRRHGIKSELVRRTLDACGRMIEWPGPRSQYGMELVAARLTAFDSWAVPHLPELVAEAVPAEGLDAALDELWPVKE